MTDQLTPPDTGLASQTELEAALRGAPAVVIEGPRACGKTSSGRWDWAAAEVKLGGVELVEQAVGSLGRLRDRVDVARMGEPTKLMVITAGGYGFEYPDGTAVVPITALGP